MMAAWAAASSSAHAARGPSQLPGSGAGTRSLGAPAGGAGVPPSIASKRRSTSTSLSRRAAKRSFSSSVRRTSNFSMAPRITSLSTVKKSARRPMRVNPLSIMPLATSTICVSTRIVPPMTVTLPVSILSMPSLVATSISEAFPWLMMKSRNSRE